MRLARLAAVFAALGCFAGPATAAPRLDLTRGHSSSLPARDALLSRVRPDLRAGLVEQAPSRMSGGRTVLQFTQYHDGHPVLGRGVRALSDGVSLKLTASLLTERFAAVEQPVTPDVARATAERAARVTFPTSGSFLAWLPTGESAQLVYAFYRASKNNLPYAPLVLVDAETGRVVVNANAVRFDRLATVHPHNPVATPVTQTVTLDALEVGSNNLSNDQFQILNCIDRGSLSKGQFKFRVCDLEQKATADANGDFPYVYGGDTEEEDEHAEVAAFFHITRGYAYFESLGLTGLSKPTLTAVVNLRMATGFSPLDIGLLQNHSLPLAPFANAFFAPDSPFGQAFGPEGLGLWFGQGAVTDFAYDGDVVVHELGHAVVAATARLVPYWHLDTTGVAPTPGAMNEGLADYFAAAMAEDPFVGEYAALSLASVTGEGHIRTLANSDRCPTEVSGEVHVDSTLFSGALWSHRQEHAPADRIQFDAAVLEAMVMAPSGDLGFDDFAELVLATVGMSPLGEQAEEALRAEFESRGILPGCTRVREYPGTPMYGHSSTFGNAFAAPGRDVVPLHPSAPYVPGVMQVRYELAPGKKTLNVRWQDVDLGSSAFGGQGDPYEPAVLAHFEDEPITFAHDPNFSSNAPDPVTVTVQGQTYRAEVAVPEGATVVHVMVVNRGESNGAYRELSLSTPTSSPPPFGGTGGALSTPSGGTGGNALADAELTPRGGCAVGSGQTSVGLWVLIGLWLARRRTNASRAARHPRSL